MSARETTNSDFKAAFDGLSRLIAEQNKHTNEKLGALTSAVQALVETSIKSEERHKQYDERFERHEENQKAQGQKIEHLSDAIISISKDIERNSDRWATLNKIIASVSIAVISAIILASSLVAKP